MGRNRRWNWRAMLAEIAGGVVCTLIVWAIVYAFYLGAVKQAELAAKQNHVWAAQLYGEAGK